MNGNTLLVFGLRVSYTFDIFSFQKFALNSNKKSRKNIKYLLIKLLKKNSLTQSHLRA